MFEPLPPRRDPRLLVVDAARRPFAYVALDPWELRGLGRLPRAGPAYALTKLALQLRPSHLVLLGDPRHLAPLRHALEDLHRRGIARLHPSPSMLARARAAAPALPVLRVLFPELRHLTKPLASARLRDLVGVAFVLLGSHSHAPRRYVSRLALRAAPPVDH